MAVNSSSKLNKAFEDYAIKKAPFDSFKEKNRPSTIANSTSGMLGNIANMATMRPGASNPLPTVTPPKEEENKPGQPTTKPAPIPEKQPQGPTADTVQQNTPKTTGHLTEQPGTQQPAPAGGKPLQNTLDMYKSDREREEAYKQGIYQGNYTGQQNPNIIPASPQFAPQGQLQPKSQLMTPAPEVAVQQPPRQNPYGIKTIPPAKPDRQKPLGAEGLIQPKPEGMGGVQKAFKDFKKTVYTEEQIEKLLTDAGIKPTKLDIALAMMHVLKGEKIEDIIQEVVNQKMKNYERMDDRADFEPEEKESENLESPKEDEEPIYNAENLEDTKKLLERLKNPTKAPKKKLNFGLSRPQQRNMYNGLSPDALREEKDDELKGEEARIEPVITPPEPYDAEKKTFNIDAPKKILPEPPTEPEALDRLRPYGKVPITKPADKKKKDTIGGMDRDFVEKAFDKFKGRKDIFNLPEEIRRERDIESITDLERRKEEQATPPKVTRPKDNHWANIAQDISRERDITNPRKIYKAYQDYKKRSKLDEKTNELGEELKTLPDFSQAWVNQAKKLVDHGNKVRARQIVPINGAKEPDPVNPEDVNMNKMFVERKPIKVIEDEHKHGLGAGTIPAQKKKIDPKRPIFRQADYADMNKNNKIKEKNKKELCPLAQEGKHPTGKTLEEIIGTKTGHRNKLPTNAPAYKTLLVPGEGESANPHSKPWEEIIEEKLNASKKTPIKKGKWGKTSKSTSSKKIGDRKAKAKIAPTGENWTKTGEGKYSSERSRPTNKPAYVPCTSPCEGESANPTGKTWEEIVEEQRQKEYMNNKKNRSNLLKAEEPKKKEFVEGKGKGLHIDKMRPETDEIEESIGEEAPNPTGKTWEQLVEEERLKKEKSKVEKSYEEFKKFGVDTAGGGAVEHQSGGFSNHTNEMPLKGDSENLPKDIGNEINMKKKIPIDNGKTMAKHSHEDAVYVAPAGTSFTDESNPHDDSFYLPTNLKHESKDSKDKAERDEKIVQEDFGHMPENVNDQGAAKPRQNFNTGEITDDNIHKAYKSKKQKEKERLAEWKKEHEHKMMDNSKGLPDEDYAEREVLRARQRSKNSKIRAKERKLPDNINKAYLDFAKGGHEGGRHKLFYEPTEENIPTVRAIEQAYTPPANRGRGRPPVPDVNEPMLNAYKQFYTQHEPKAGKNEFNHKPENKKIGRPKKQIPAEPEVPIDTLPAVKEAYKPYAQHLVNPDRGRGRPPGANLEEPMLNAYKEFYGNKGKKPEAPKETKPEIVEPKTEPEFTPPVAETHKKSLEDIASDKFYSNVDWNNPEEAEAAVNNYNKYLNQLKAEEKVKQEEEKNKPKVDTAYEKYIKEKEDSKTPSLMEDIPVETHPIEGLAPEEKPEHAGGIAPAPKQTKTEKKKLRTKPVLVSNKKRKNDGREFLKLYPRPISWASKPNYPIAVNVLDKILSSEVTSPDNTYTLRTGKGTHVPVKIESVNVKNHSMTIFTPAGKFIIPVMFDENGKPIAVDMNEFDAMEAHIASINSNAKYPKEKIRAKDLTNNIKSILSGEGGEYYKVLPGADLARKLNRQSGGSREAKKYEAKDFARTH